MSSTLLLIIVVILVLLLMLLLYSKDFRYRLRKAPHYNYVIVDDGTAEGLGLHSIRPCQCPNGLNIIEIDEDLLGELQTGEIGKAGGGVQGENITFRWDTDELVIANIIVSQFNPCNNSNEPGKPSNQNQSEKGNQQEDEKSDKIELCYRKYSTFDYILDRFRFTPLFDETLNNPINIAILDTPCDRKSIRAYLNSESARNFKVRIKNVTCTNPYNSKNTNHGTAVLIRFLQKLIQNGNTQDVNIKVYNILDSDGSVRLSSVLCALGKAKSDGNSYFNMSFGFGKVNSVLKSEISNLMSNGTVVALTCSAGNDKRDLGNPTYINIPSGFARPSSSHPRIYEVIGLNNNNELWVDGLKGSNYILNSSNLYAADATFNGVGGTSFSAPRILADLVSGGLNNSVASPIIPISGLKAILEN